MIDITSEPGSYLLHLNLSQMCFLKIGRLGEYWFSAGDYVYFGSAFGFGGLRARILRHLKLEKRFHWHIDFLRAKAQLYGFGYLIQDQKTCNHLRLECLWSQAVASLPHSRIPVIGFGATDCKSGCLAHLVEFSERVILRDLVKFLSEKTEEKGL